MRGFSHTPVSKSMNRWVRLPGNTLVFNNAGFQEISFLEKQGPELVRACFLQLFCRPGLSG
jgi:hypothetical protein